MKGSRIRYSHIANSENFVVDDGNNNNNESNSRYMLVEIVSALNVDILESNPNPFVTVSIGGHQIHRTDVLRKSRYPIWSMESGSFFLLDLDHINENNNPPASSSHHGSKGSRRRIRSRKLWRQQQGKQEDAVVSFCLKEHEVLWADPTLGTVDIPIDKLRKGNGQRREYRLTIPRRVLDICKQEKILVRRAARLVLRFKPASQSDVVFLKNLDVKKAGIHSEEAYLPPTQSTSKISFDTSKRIRFPQIAGCGTASMQRSQIAEQQLEEAAKPSEEWVNVGSGTNLKVYVEILACDDLPNLDLPQLSNLSNLTDAFCCLIMENSITNTSVIRDNLSPRWMPTDTRAFVFHVQHPSSPLYVGIFNWKNVHRPLYKFKEWIHDPIGRVVINMTRLCQETVYTLDYNIYELDEQTIKNREEQKHNGTIKIRLRIEWGAHFQGGILPSPTYFVAVPGKHDFQIATYTTVGERPGAEEFSITTMTTYIDELSSYIDEDTLDSAILAMLTILLWRPHYEVTLLGRKLCLPLHSMVAFTWGVLVTQNYNRFPSFILFCLAWIFLASMEQNLRHPSPWHRCKSYGSLFRALVAFICNFCFGERVGSLARKKETIVANENLPSIRAFQEAERKRKEIKQELKIKEEEQLEEEIRKHKAEMAVLTEVNIATIKRAAFSPHTKLLKPILHPYQLILRRACIAARTIRSLLSWEQNYYPFWIVTASLVLSFLIFFVPWGRIVRWVARVAVWITLGPWMRIVDWYYFDQVDTAMSEEEKQEYLEKAVKARQKGNQAERIQSRRHREERVKMKSMMKYLFGKYVVRIPRFREAQFLDYPLPSSTAVPFEGGDEVKTVGQVCGQTLIGDMIPERMIRTQNFQKEIIYEKPSERLTERLTKPFHRSSTSTETHSKKKKMRRLSFLKKLS